MAVGVVVRYVQRACGATGSASRELRDASHRCTRPRHARTHAHAAPRSPTSPRAPARLAEGVITAKKDFNLAKHPEIEASNLEVIKLMTSLTSRDLVTSRFAWNHYYWFLTDEGIEHLREYLHLDAEVVPNTLKKSTKPAAAPPGRPGAEGADGRPPRGPPREGGREGYRAGGDGAPRGFGRGGGAPRPPM